MIPFRTDEEITRAIPEVVLHLVRHGLIAYPTETVYGFGSSASTEAVNSLSALKGREPGKPFLLLVSDLSMVFGVGLRLPDAADRLATAFWPGPLTLVLPGGEGRLPQVLRGPEGGIAVRWTSHAGVARLVKTLGSPITSTSANRPRTPPAMDGASVTADFAAAVASGDLLVLDAGKLTPSPPSTLVDCTGSQPRVIRVGAIAPDRLRSIVPSLVGG
ncbi:MAG TPA: L-threonylcarbamoyladenylate synthase [Gemmatimonadales bacterium]